MSTLTRQKEHADRKAKCLQAALEKCDETGTELQARVQQARDDLAAAREQYGVSANELKRHQQDVTLRDYDAAKDRLDGDDGQHVATGPV